VFTCYGTGVWQHYSHVCIRSERCNLATIDHFSTGYGSVAKRLRTMAETSSTVRVGKLKRGGDFSLWSAHARAYLCKQGLLSLITDSRLSTDEAKAGDALCRASILLLMEGPELTRIVDRARTAKEAWDGLKDQFDGQLAHQQHVLIADAGDLRQKQGETAEAYRDRALDLFC
jgi:hypothetical protein